MTALTRRFLALLLTLTALLPAAAGAEALVLIPGYLEDGGSWRQSGVTRVLAEAGWRDGGQLTLGAEGEVQPGSGEVSGNRRFYTIRIATEAPFLAQLRQLEPLLAWVRARHPGETLVLAGHSAGGVLARLYMVQHPDSGVDALITVASPHLGTDTAELGLLAGQSPLAMIAPMLGAEVLNRSQGLYYDLAREQPGGFLYWLNHQPHPDALYVSVVRRDDSLLGIGDMVVPARSQDLNQVEALRGRAQTLYEGSGHLLQASDGEVILRILRQLERS